MICVLIVGKGSCEFVGVVVMSWWYSANKAFSCLSNRQVETVARAAEDWHLHGSCRCQDDWENADGFL